MKLKTDKIYPVKASGAFFMLDFAEFNRKSFCNREGAFSIYKDKKVKLVGYKTCDGSSSGNIEYAPEEMKKMEHKSFT